MAQGTASKTITINLADEGRLQTLRTILGYESVMRGLTTGQALVALLGEATDESSYPREVRKQLAEIRSERLAAAARRCLLEARAS